MKDNFIQIIQSPASLLALLALALIIFALTKIKKVKLDIKIMAYIGISLALSTILKMITIYHLPQGGSVTAGSMVPILLMAFFFGPEVGYITGFLYGLITLMLDPYIMHPIQVLFDYPLPFMALGLAGYFKDKKILGTVIAILARYIFHVISGVVFFASFAPEGTSPLIYSLVYNGTFLGLDGAICLILVAILPLSRMYSLINKNA